MEAHLKGRFWLCQGCGRHVPARLTECRCGFSREGLGAAGFEQAGESAPASDGPAWFAVGPAKLIVMSTATLGLYQIYWFYRQWRSVRDSGEAIRPLPRSIFGVLYCYPLFRRVFESARGLAGADPAVPAAVYIVLCLSSQLPLPYGLLAVLSVVPLAHVQRVANAVALRDFPDEAPETRFTGANWVALSLAGAFLAFLAYAAVAREKATSLESLSRVAAEENLRPHTASEGVQFERAVAQEGMMVYHFNVTDEARARIEERKPLLKRAMTPGVCKDRLLVLSVSVRFVYTAANGETVATVDVSPRDCS